MTEVKEKIEKDYYIDINGISACESFKTSEGEIAPLFSEVSFRVKPTDVWCLYADNPKEAEALIEAVGNMKPYYEGHIEYYGQHHIATHFKKMISPLTYYIDTAEMLTPELSVLEQVLFTLVAKKSQAEVLQLQKAMLEKLISLGFGHLALSKIHALTNAEKLVLELFIAGLSECDTVFLNVTQYEFSVDDIMLLKNVVSEISGMGKAIVLATIQPALIGMAGEKTIYLKHGRMEYIGLVSRLIEQWDDVVCVIKDTDITQVVEQIKAYNDSYFEIEGNYAYMFYKDKNKWSPADFYAWLSENNITPDMVKLNNGRVANSFKRLSRKDVI